MEFFRAVCFLISLFFSMTGLKMIVDDKTSLAGWIVFVLEVIVTVYLVIN